MVENPSHKNIIVFGITGNGKSTLLNKLMVAIEAKDEYSMMFEAKNTSGGVT